MYTTLILCSTPKDTFFFYTVNFSDDLKGCCLRKMLSSVSEVSEEWLKTLYDAGLSVRQYLVFFRRFRQYLFPSKPDSGFKSLKCAIQSEKTSVRGIS